MILFALRNVYKNYNNIWCDWSQLSSELIIETPLVWFHLAVFRIISQVLELHYHLFRVYQKKFFI